MQHQKRKSKIGIFVIAYNAESAIQKTLQRIPRTVWSYIHVVYVIDDCSTDETTNKALSFKKYRNKLVVLRNPVNRIYGGNQKIGYQYAIDNHLDVVVMLHADGQYAPEYLEKLISPIVNGKADIVIGSRMIKRGDALKGGMPLYKYYGNILLTKIQNILTGMNLSEFHSGYRAYSTKFLRHIPFWENTNNWHFDTEILLQAKESNSKIQEVCIPTFYGNEICHVNGIPYAIHCIATSFAYYLFRKKIFYSRIFDISKQRYTGKLNDPFSSHTKIVDKLKNINVRGKKILEIGIGDATVTKRISELGGIVDVVDIDRHALNLAKPFCRKAYKINLEDIERFRFYNDYDIAIVADVLEHIRNPELVLSKLKTFVKTHGILIVSLPNVANIYVRLNLLFGRFPYHTKGILDETHVHFYTLTTAEQLLRRTGWVITTKDITNIPISIVFPFLSVPPYLFVLKLVHYITNMEKSLFAYQGLFFCTNPNRSTLL